MVHVEIMLLSLEIDTLDISFEECLIFVLEVRFNVKIMTFLLQCACKCIFKMDNEVTDGIALF